MYIFGFPKIFLKTKDEARFNNTGVRKRRLNPTINTMFPQMPRLGPVDYVQTANLKGAFSCLGRKIVFMSCAFTDRLLFFLGSFRKET